jgi:peroxiredoxin family protein
MTDKSMTIIATKGTLDWAYPPFILSSTAAALGYNVTMFFTFYGLQLLKKDLSLSVQSPWVIRVCPCPCPWTNGFRYSVPPFPACRR